MCGILMSYGINEKIMRDALNQMNYRGPFNKGYLHIDNIGIGMVQLPMKKKEQDKLPIKYKTYYVSYNGEIYDSRAVDISKEIEIIIDGIVNLKAINGMFALAAYNELKKEIIIARDEFGIKPIYYFIDEDKEIFICCSEIVPILNILHSVKINKSTIAEIIIFGTQTSESTCFSNIFLLEPGNIISIDIHKMKIKRNFLPPLEPHSNSLEELLHESVSACADTFREPSLLLSDGLDSNLLLTYLDKSINKYNLILEAEDGGVNKENYINLNQTSLNRENYLSELNKAVLSYAQPCRMSSLLMYQTLSDFIRNYNSHMVVTGEGADEFFWGYPRYNFLENKSAVERLNLKKLFFGDVEKNLILLNQPIERKKNSYLMNNITNYSKDIFQLIDFLERKFSLEPLLRRSDHILMRNTIETRVPFLHFGIPHLAKSIGLKRINKEYNKYPLIKIMKKRNPNYLIKSKQHFRAPLKEWFSKEKWEEHFDTTQLEILANLGVSIDELRKSYQNGMFNQVFISKTMVVWYEKFSQYF
jgi:asparagine synthase (glutamine-hydrolysing)